MPYIKINAGVVELGGNIPHLTDDSEWFMYNGYIPQANILAWDDVAEIVVVHADALPQAQREKLNSINNAFETEQSVIDAQFPEREQASWVEQARQAREYITDPTTPGLLIYNIAKSRGVSLDTLVTKIIEKNDQYSVLLGNAIGKRQSLEDTIYNISTLPEDLEASIGIINGLTWEDTPL